MKKFVMVVTVCLFLVGLIACGGGGKYADAKAAMEEMTDLMDEFGNSLEKANDGKTVAAAIEKFTDRFQNVQKKMEELSKKYPDLKDQKDIPEELKETMTKLDAASQKMGTMMAKIFQFASDPEVAKAFEKMKSVR